MIREELVRQRLEAFINRGAAVTEDLTSEEKSLFHQKAEAFQGMLSASKLFIGAMLGVNVTLEQR